MRLERVTGTGHELYRQALELYQISFPAHEQRESPSQAAILSDPAYQFQLIFDGDIFVGLLLCWETEEFLYVEHFCILPQLRNRRYGQRTLELLARRGRRVILEIDPPGDPVSLRRREFYLRCGFVENPFPHVHPPYHRGAGGHRLVVMSLPAPLTREEYGRFQRYLTQHVMADAY